MIGRGIARGNVGLVALALDLADPPLALLGLLLTLAIVVTGSAVLFGVSSAALIISAASFAAFALAVPVSCITHRRDVLSGAAFLSIGPCVVGNLSLYQRFLLPRRPIRSVRTVRN